MACSLGGERGFLALFLPRGFGLLRGAYRSAAVRSKSNDFISLNTEIRYQYCCISERSCMTDAASPPPGRSALSAATRSLRLQRIFGRLQDGVGYAGIAAEEGLGRSAAERPERPSPEQGLENAQNGKG